MSSRRALVVLVVGVCVVLGACTDGFGFGSERIDGSGNVETRSFDVEDFDRVEVNGALEGDVTVSPGSAITLEITADDNFFDHIDVEVSGDTVEVGPRSNVTFRSDDPVLVTVVMPSLRGVEATGATAVTVRAEGTDVNDFEASGASRLTVTDLDGSDLNIDISGASRGTFAGDGAETADVDVSGASSIDLRQLPLTSATVDVSGASSAEIGPADVVSGSVSGASRLRVAAETRLDVETSGGSSARRR